MFVKIENILEQVKLDLDLQTDRKDLSILSHIISGVRVLALAGQTVPKAVLLPINQNIKTVNLPADFVDYVSIGILCGEKVHKFTQGRNYAKLFYKDNCGNEIIEKFNACCKQQNLEFESTFGHFDIDIANGRIRLDTRVLEDKIYLEYISNGIDADGDVWVREAAFECLRAYVHYQLSMHPRITQEVQMRLQEFNKQKTILNRINNPITIESIREIVDRNRTFLIR